MSGLLTIISRKSCGCMTVEGESCNYESANIRRWDELCPTHQAEKNAADKLPYAAQRLAFLRAEVERTRKDHDKAVLELAQEESRCPAT